MSEEVCETPQFKILCHAHLYSVYGYTLLDLQVRKSHDTRLCGSVMSEAADI